MSDELRVLLVDDHAILRAGLRALLDAEADMRVVGEAGSGEEAIDLLPHVKPDIVVMDITMPGMGGVEATRRIMEAEEPPYVLILTMHGEEEHLLSVLEAGGAGFVRKTSADEDLTKAIRTVAADQVFLYPAAAKLLLNGYRVQQGKSDDDPLDPLSERERQVLAMTAEGFSSTEIGSKLFISPKTVDTYRSRIMDKLELHHRSELVRFALRTGLLSA
ncbi:MAG TPA: response regulator transcription factor [Longimicrobiales bacterium]|nr:response regulator transcription factor [Longimicrobiales bacterium]